MVEYREKRSVKDLIESLGVPHTELDVIIVGGDSVRFDYQVRDGDSIDVYPPGAETGVRSVVHLQPEIEGPLQFVCDVHLEKLMRRLRLLGPLRRENQPP